MGGHLGGGIDPSDLFVSKPLNPVTPCDQGAAMASIPCAFIVFSLLASTANAACYKHVFGSSVFVLREVFSCHD